MPNAFAYVALFAWPVVVMILFRRLPLPAALVWSILGGFLLLPPGVAIDLPGLPTLDKTTIPSLSAAVMCLIYARPGRGRRARARQAVPGRRAMTIPVVACVTAILLGTFLTVAGNPETLSFDLRTLPGLRPYDTASMMLAALVMLIPFALARRYLATHEAQVTILLALALAGLAYTIPALLEVRLSPQLNKLIYGFFPHSFAQQKRFGGFRPVVFLQHGLVVALFMMMALTAAAVLWRTRAERHAAPSEGRRRIGVRRPARWGLAVLWLAGVLVLCKTVGAIALALLVVPAVLLLGPRMQVALAAILALCVLLYPMLRGADLVPTRALVAVAERIDPSKAGSLQFRFENEDILLARAAEKPVSGWGGWGRGRIYDETGRDISVTDGTWVIFIGQFGWLGYLARFGLLCLPIVFLAFRGRVDRVTAGLSLVLAANLVDLLPNSGLTPLTWMVAGALSAYKPVAQDGPVTRETGRRAPAGAAPPARRRPTGGGRGQPAAAR